MANTVIIIFIGLIAFVPNSNDPGIWALLVDTEAPLPICTDPLLATGFERHEATLIVPKNVVKVVGGDCDRREVQYSTGAMYEFPLKDVDLRLTDPFNGEKELVLGGGRARHEDGSPYWVPRDPRESLDASWVANLSEFAPERSSVKQACQRPGLRPIDLQACGITGRALLKTGTLETECVVRRSKPEEKCRGEYPEYITYQIVSPSQPQNVSDPGYSLGEGLQLRMSQLQGTLALTLLYVKSGKQCGVNVDTSSGATIYLANQHRMDGQPHAIECSGIGSRDMKHFMLYYNLTDQGSSLDCPYPVMVCAPFGSPRCPLAMFLADE